MNSSLLGAIARGVVVALRAFRLRRRLGLMAIIMSTFAIAIGFNGAVFSIVSTVLLQDPPFARPDQLTMVELPSESGPPVNRIPGNLFQSWQRDTRAFDGMAGFFRRSVALQLGDRTWRTEAAEVSPALFKLLGIATIAGRGFLPEEEVATAGCVVVVDDGLWNGALGRRELALLPELRIDGRSCRVVGVIASTQAFPDSRVQLWLPLDPRPLMERLPNGSPRVSSKSFGLIARLADGITLDQAVDEMRRLNPRDLGQARLVTIKEHAARRLRPLLILLQVVAGLVLLAACINVVGLLLADGLRRMPEITVKASIGAPLSSLIVERLAEIISLATIGGILGVLLAGSALAMVRTSLGGDIPQLTRVSMDWRMFVFTGVLSLLSGLLTGILPALRTCHLDVRGAAISPSRNGLLSRANASPYSWRLLVGGEVSISLALLVLAASLGTTLVHELNADRGYQAENVAVMEVSLPTELYPTMQTRQNFVDVLLTDLRRHSGVERAAAATSLTVSVSRGSFSFDPPPPPSGELLFRGDKVLRYAFVSDHYFETLSIPLHQGRTFTDRDGELSTRVAIVSASIAQRDFPGQSPIGHSVHQFRGRDWQIIGVVGDVREGRLEASSVPLIYFPLAQLGRSDDGASWRLQKVHVVALAPGRSDALTHILLEALARADPRLVPHGVSTLRAALQSAVAHVNLYAVCFGLLAATGLAIASLGLFALLAHGVALRTREIGIRIALGAEPSRLFATVVAEGIGIVITGLCIGLPLAWALRRTLNASISGLTQDWLAFAIGSSVLLFVALVSCLQPAWRATRVDPLVSIRHS